MLAVRRTGARTRKRCGRKLEARCWWGLSYAPGDNSIALLQHKQDGLVSAYAARRDYHDVIKGKLKQLAQWLARETGAEVKVFVDTAPLMEKPLAERAGLGWQGKHTNLVSREHGSCRNRRRSGR